MDVRIGNTKNLEACMSINRRDFIKICIGVGGVFLVRCAPLPAIETLHPTSVPAKPLEARKMARMFPKTKAKKVNKVTTVDAFVTSITPTVGANVLVNGDFSAWTGGNPDGWTVTRSAPNLDVTQVAPNEGHGGVGAGALNLWQAAAGSAKVSQAIAPYKAYRLSANVTKLVSGRATVGGLGLASLYANPNATGSFTFDSLVWGLTTFIIEAGANPSDITIDDVSFREMTGIYGPAVTCSKDFWLSSPIYWTPGSIIGYVLSADSYPDPQNCVVIYIGTYQVGAAVKTQPYARVFKRVNGAWSYLDMSGQLLIAASPATVDFKIVKVGNLYSVYIDTTLEKDQCYLSTTISDATIVNNTINYQLSTNPASTWGSVTKKTTTGWHGIFGVGDSKMLGAYAPGTYYSFFEYMAKGYELPNRIGRAGTTWSSWTYPLADLVGVSEYITVNLGVNDAATGVIPASEAAWRVGADIIISALHAKWPSAKIFIAHIWCATSYGFGTNRPAVNQALVNTWIDNLITANSAFCYNGLDERMVLENGDNGVSRTMDGLHPNAAGNAACASAWEAAIAAIVPGY
jgi:hypothetical protein